MNTLVFNKFDLKRSELNKNLEKELLRVKQEASARGMLHSSGSINQMRDLIFNNCRAIIGALINTYEAIDEISPRFIIRNENIIRNEVAEQLSAEYRVYENKITKLVDNINIKTNFNLFSDIRNEMQRKVDILIETAKLKDRASPTISHTEQEYNILAEKFENDNPVASDIKYNCFVIMPIGDEDKSPIEYKNNMAVFNKIVKPCVENSKYKINCYHADDELVTKTGDISKQIFESIQNEAIVVVDLRRQNPNVIYEMCMRHAFGGRTILICSDFKQNFFHNTKYRAIKYWIDGRSNQEFYRRIQVAIVDLINNPDLSDNPIKDWLEKTEVQSESEENLSEAANDVLKECLMRDLSEFYESEMISYVNRSSIEIESAFDELRDNGLIIQRKTITDERGAGYGLTPSGRKYVLKLDKIVHRP